VKGRELLERLGLRQRSKPPPVPEQPELGSSELSRRRSDLTKEFVELQWDLGGLAYEMASRDHFRVDVLVRQSARLQQVDAELAEVERLLRLDQAGAAGACPACGALYARGAVFCWQCGKDLVGRSKIGPVPGVGAGEQEPAATQRKAR
jgi:hypothetical protein